LFLLWSRVVASLSPPARIGPYEVLGKLGGGGMATVFLGRKVVGRGIGSVAALKVMLADLAIDPHFVQMFDDEAKLLAVLNHPNLSKTLESGTGDHLGYIAMELLLGRTLADTWEAAHTAEHPFPFALTAWICAQVARGLHHAHDVKDETGAPFHLIHRDVNPSNIFLTYDGSVKLFDFGLAKAQGRTSKTKTGIVKGKVPYLSPEQLSQLPLDRRSDVFSLGTTLWEMTTLTRLFKRENDLDTILAIRNAIVPDPRSFVDDYPDALWDIVKRSLAADREERHATAVQLADELDAFAASQGARDSSSALVTLLQELFPGERETQARWLEKTASLPPTTNMTTMAPPAPLVPSAEIGSLQEMTDAVPLGGLSETRELREMREIRALRDIRGEPSIPLDLIRRKPQP